jgi:hypothetical protein
MLLILTRFQVGEACSPHPCPLPKGAREKTTYFCVLLFSSRRNGGGKIAYFCVLLFPGAGEGKLNDDLPAFSPLPFRKKGGVRVLLTQLLTGRQSFAVAGHLNRQ